LRTNLPIAIGIDLRKQQDHALPRLQVQGSMSMMSAQ
jgi:hypothetical protein